MKVKPTSKSGEVVVEMGQHDPEMLASEQDSITMPFRLRKILVPVDFSECSRKALLYAKPFARQFNASITLVHVVQINYGGGEFGMVDVPLLETQMREGATKHLADILEKELGEGIAGQSVVLVGRPVNEIVQLAKDQQIDLIIIATHGHTGWRHVLLGSIAENVIRHAPCPVLTVREHEHDFVKEEATPPSS